MKSVFAAVLSAGLLAGCADSAERLDDTPAETPVERVPDRQNAIAVDPLANRTLADFLVRAPGVYVDERGAATRVLIRGRAPLYVFDDVPIGYSYQEANALFVPNDVAQVEVLTGPEATILYGGRAAGGAVVVSTR